MKKWGLKAMCGLDGIRAARRDGAGWIVPFCRFTAAGEPTTYTVVLRFPDLPQEEMGEHNLLLGHFYDRGAVVEAEVEPFDLRYRPFPGRVVARELSQFATGLQSVLWYLENGQSPVCASYRYMRGIATGGIRVAL